MEEIQSILMSFTGLFFLHKVLEKDLSSVIGVVGKDCVLIVRQLSVKSGETNTKVIAY